MMPWVNGEFDDSGAPHSRHREVPCPKCGRMARESECFDVGGHWIICLDYGVND